MNKDSNSNEIYFTNGSSISFGSTDSDLKAMDLDVSSNLSVEYDEEINYQLDREIEFSFDLKVEQETVVCPNCNNSIMVPSDFWTLYLKMDYSCDYCGFPI